MASTSTRFSLNKYSAGDKGWDHSDLVDKFDEYGIERDTVGNRTTGNYDQQLFYATDENILYIWDDIGETWDVALRLGIDGSHTEKSSTGFGTWISVDSTGQGVLVDLEAQVQTDGSSNGIVNLYVDESGNNSANHKFTAVGAHNSLGSGAINVGTLGGVFVPPGGNYKAVNESDPNDYNSIQTLREITI